MSEFICGFVCTIIGIVLYQRLYVRYRLWELTEERDEATRWKDAWRNMAGDLVNERREDATAARNQIAQLKRQVGTPQWPVCIHCGKAMELGYGMAQKGLAWRCANHQCPYRANGRQWGIVVYPPQDY
jgi:hypothetical protein